MHQSTTNVQSASEINMKIYFGFCVLNLILVNVICLSNEVSIVQSYMLHKNLKYCTFLNCWTLHEVLSTMKEIKVSSRFWSIRKYLNDTDDTDQRFNMLYVLFYNCDGSFQALKKAGERKHLKYKHKWLIFVHNTEDFSLPQLEDIELRFNSDIKLAFWSAEKIVRIYDVYNTGYKKNGSLVQSYYGFWNQTTNSLFVKDSMERYHKQSVLSGVVLHSSTVVTNPEVTANYANYLSERKATDIISKFSNQLFLNFQKMHNFTHIQLVQDKWFGNEVGGLEDGVAKQLHEEVIDLSSVVGLIKKDRVAFFDFVNPMYRFSTSFMFRNRGTHDLWENEFLKPFTTKVWLSIVLVLMLLSVFLKMTNWIETFLVKSNGSYSIFTAILISVSVICQQGSYIIPSRLTSRFLFFMILILSFLLYNYYTSSIVSALLNAKPRELTSYKDLIKSGLELGIQMAPYTLTIFETNKDPDIQAIRKLVFPDRVKPHVWNITDGIEKIRTGPYAYHLESTIAYILIAKTFDAGAICELSDKIALIPASYLSFYLKKDSQYKNLLKISLRKMQETGLVHRSRLIWEKKKPACFANAILLSVGLDQTFIAFFILFVGLAISVLLLFFERWYCHQVT